MVERVVVVFLLVAPWPLVAVGAGCFVTEIGDAIVACDVASDCPEPLFCDGGRCRRGSAGDVTAPGVEGGSVRLGDGAVRPGSGTSLSFTATEPVAETPRLASAGLAFGDVVDDAGSFSVDVTALAGADEGPHDIDVVLVDVAGNTSEPVFLATLTVDATPPALEASQVPATVPPGQAFVIGGSASEALAAATCTFNPIFAADEIVAAGVVAGVDFSCDGPAFDLAATAIQVDAVLVDLAGNEASVDLGSISVFNAP